VNRKQPFGKVSKETSITTGDLARRFLEYRLNLPLLAERGGGVVGNKECLDHGIGYAELVPVNRGEIVTKGDSFHEG
jgi:hypothetical protein